jgi:hypothetical protein
MPQRDTEKIIEDLSHLISTNGRKLMKNLNKRFAGHLDGFASNASILRQQASQLVDRNNTAYGVKINGNDLNRLFGGLLNNFSKHTEESDGCKTGLIGGILNNVPKYAASISSKINDSNIKQHSDDVKSKLEGFIDSVSDYAQILNVNIGSKYRQNSNHQKSKGFESPDANSALRRHYH